MSGLQRKKKPKGRKCSICDTHGHNARTCPNKNKPIVESSVKTISKKKLKDKELGRKILAEKAVVEDRIEVEGLVPRKNYWLVNKDRQKIAGKILQVKKNGDILWKDIFGATQATNQKRLIDQGYSYIEDLEVEMLDWNILGRK
jgi:hypothetical protein